MQLDGARLQQLPGARPSANSYMGRRPRTNKPVSECLALPPSDNVAVFYAPLHFRSSLTKMANAFINRADSGFTTNEHQARRPNLADQHGQNPAPHRVQERISSYRGLLDWETLEEYLRKIWSNETRATLNPRMVSILARKAQQCALIRYRSRILGYSQPLEGWKVYVVLNTTTWAIGIDCY